MTNRNQRMLLAIAHRAIDAIGQQTTDSSCVVTTTSLSIGGRVFRSDEVTPVAAATVTIGPDPLAVDVSAVTP